MAALFLRGGPRRVALPRREWVAVHAALRRVPCRCEEAGGVLHEQGYRGAAVVLETPGLLEWAKGVVRSDRCLTIADEAYPRRLLQVLGGPSPPVLWCAGDISALQGPFASVVGSRDVSGLVAAFARRAGRECARAGVTVVSGGAHGCDRLAEQGALREGGSVIRIVPHGISGCSGGPRLLVLSVRAPDEEFSTAAAMERNALIYAFSERSLVAQSRFREGGTWQGAVEALRRRRTNLFFRETGETWGRAFQALGGHPIREPAEFLAASIEEARTGLFEVA